MVLHCETVKRFDFIRTYFIQSRGRYGTKQLEHLLGGAVRCIFILTILLSEVFLSEKLPPMVFI
jgi:hypothetical protein